MILICEYPHFFSVLQEKKHFMKHFAYFRVQFSDI